jgi:hypothetical protein
MKARVIPFILLMIGFALIALTHQTGTFFRGFAWGMGRHAASSIWRHH